MADDATHLQITRALSIPLNEIDVRFSASGGPGGQHANKAATRVEMTFDAEASPSLGPRHRDLILKNIGPVVRVVVDEERSQLRNRTIALQRLRVRLASAVHVQAPRRATKPSRGSKERRLKSKRERGTIKQNRRRPDLDH